MYPRLVVNLNHYRDNVRQLKKKCHQSRLSMMAVSKSYCALQPLIDVLNEERVSYIADSRIMNLKDMKTSLPKVLLRLTSMSEVEDVLDHVNISFQSEIETIEALNAAAKKKNINHNIVLMIDVGDLREGHYYKDDVIPLLNGILACEQITLIGLATNLTCYGGVIPTPQTLQKFVRLVDVIEHHIGRSLQLISGGNSSHLHLLDTNINFPKINNLRLGEALVLGRETAYGKALEYLHQDVVILETEIIELKYKPSYPEGDIGMDAFGATPMIEDVGYHWRGILAIGRQDVDYHQLIPEDEGIRLLGSSSDHIIVDLSQSKQPYTIGDVLRFRLSYGSLLSTMTSPYVRKVYVE